MNMFESPRETIFLVDDDMVNLSFGYDVLEQFNFEKVELARSA